MSSTAENPSAGRTGSCPYTLASPGMSPRKSRTGGSTSFKSTPPLPIAQTRASCRFRRFRPLFTRTLVICDQYWGRMFVRMCPYLPFSARVCLNQHHWLANRMREEAIDFQQCSNAFLRCGAPERLQQLADTPNAEDLASCGRKWLARRTPFFTETERKQAGCQHRLLFSQIEFCDNLIFHRRAALDKLAERLLDANRTIGQPNKITVIFGRKVTKQYRGKLQTEIEDIHLPNPVIRS